MMSEILGWSLIVGFLGSLVYAIVRLHWIMQLRHVTSTPVAVNDCQLAEEEFVKLLKEAKNSMIIYDD